MTNAESLKVRTLSLIATVAVVIGHAKCNSHLDQVLRPWLIWHVPWFFVVSGYFFMVSLEKYSLVAFLGKKFYSLIVPYFIWCIIGYLLWMPKLSPTDGVLDILGIGKSIFPFGNWALWYVRGLIIIMSGGLVIFLIRTWITSSVIFFMIYCVIMVSAYYICTKSGVGISPGSGVASFLIGNFLGFFRFPLTIRLQIKYKWMLLLTFFFIAAVVRISCGHSAFFTYPFILLMISGLWILFDIVQWSDNAFVGKIMVLSPIVYFIHYPFIFAFDKYIPIRGFITNNQVESKVLGDLLYVSRCFLFLSFLFGWGFVFKKYCPSLYKICSGGR